MDFDLILAVLALAVATFAAGVGVGSTLERRRTLAALSRGIASQRANLGL